MPSETPIPDEIVERAAKALFDLRWCPWQERRGVLNECREDARAAIAAADEARGMRQERHVQPELLGEKVGPDELFRLVSDWGSVDAV